MVDWKAIGVQLISAVITSSVIIGILGDLINSSLNDRPDVNIRAEPLIISPVLNFGHSLRTDLVGVGYITTITNDGRAPAINLEVSINYPNISNATKTSITENLGGSYDARVLPFNASRKDLGIDIGTLASGGIVTINTISAMNTSNISTVPDYCTIFALYEGKDASNGDNNNNLYNEKYECTGYSLYPFSFELTISSLIFSLILLIAFILPRKIRLFKDKRNREHFILNIFDEIILVRDSLRDDNYSTNVFTSYLWNSKTLNRKMKIFYNYDDYKVIDEFYNELKKRDSYLRQRDVSNDIIYNHNKKCLDLSETVISVVNWNAYYDNRKVIRKRNNIPITPLIVLGSLFISYICEALPIFFLLQIYPFNPGVSLLISIALIFIARTYVSFIISKAICKLKISYVSNLNSSASSNNHFSRRDFLVNNKKNFTLSASITGPPVITISLILIFFLSNFSFSYRDTLLFGTIFLSVDIARFMILNFILIKRTKAIHAATKYDDMRQ